MMEFTGKKWGCFFLGSLEVKKVYCSCRRPRFSTQYHVEWLTTICDSRSRGIWRPCLSRRQHRHIHTHTLTHVIEIKINVQKLGNLQNNGFHYENFSYIHIIPCSYPPPLPSPSLLSPLASPLPPPDSYSSTSLPYSCMGGVCVCRFPIWEKL